MTITLSLLILAILGLLLYAFASNGKLAEVGRIVFFCATLALCFGASPHVPRLGR
jgi:hypothetical protein